MVAGVILFASTTFSSRSYQTLPSVKTFEATGILNQRDLKLEDARKVGEARAQQFPASVAEPSNPIRLFALIQNNSINVILSAAAMNLSRLVVWSHRILAFLCAFSPTSPSALFTHISRFGEFLRTNYLTVHSLEP
jgi:hypothetical protein